MFLFGEVLFRLLCYYVGHVIHPTRDPLSTTGVPVPLVLEHPANVRFSLLYPRKIYSTNDNIVVR